ncbi:MAG: SPFH domain-containing protein [Terrabacter sp.]
MTIRYSLNPGKLPEIIRQYPDQETFIARAVLPGVSSVTRDAPTTFAAAAVRQSRGQLAQRITEGLEKRLGEVGVTVEQVDPRAITLDQNVQANYDKVQSSLANAEAAKADLRPLSPKPRSPRPRRRRPRTPTRSSAAAPPRPRSRRSSTARRSRPSRSCRSAPTSARTASTSRS